MLGNVYQVKTPDGAVYVVLFHDWCSGMTVCCPVTQELPARGEILLSVFPSLSAGLWGAGTIHNAVLQQLGTVCGSIPDQLRIIIDECWKASFGGHITLPEDQLERLLGSGDEHTEPSEAVSDAMRWLQYMDMAYYDNGCDIDIAREVVDRIRVKDKRKKAKQDAKASKRKVFRKACIRASRED